MTEGTGMIKEIPETPESPNLLQSLLGRLLGVEVSVATINRDDLLRLIGLPVIEPDPATPKGKRHYIEKMLAEANHHRDHLMRLCDFYADSARTHGLEIAVIRHLELQAWLDGWRTNVILPIRHASIHMETATPDDPRTLPILSAVQDAVTGYLGAMRTVRQTVDDRHRAVMVQLPIDTVLSTASNTPPHDPIIFDLSSLAPSGVPDEEQDSESVAFEPATE